MNWIPVAEVKKARYARQYGELDERSIVRKGNIAYAAGLALLMAGDPEAALQTARIYLRREQYTQALDWAQRAAQRPDSTEPLQIAVSAGLAACSTLVWLLAVIVSGALFTVNKPLVFVTV